MALSLLFQKTKVKIGVLQLDASLSETHTRNLDVTSFPVEEGADISDHVRRQPEEVSITGIVSNTPIVFLASVSAESPIEGDLTPVEDRVELAYAELQRIQDDGELVTVVTSLREYENMVLTSFGVTRDSANGNVLNSQLTLREVLQARLETVEAPEPRNTSRGKKIEDKKVPTTPASEPVADKSILVGLLGS